MTDSEREHIRHIARIARYARRDLKIAMDRRNIDTDLERILHTLEEIENSARHALADGLATP